MAQVTVRANLSSVQIPLTTEEFGRSVIVRQQDLNYVPTVSSKADLDKDVGIPQIIYAHNVMPTNYGYTSVAYSSQIPAKSTLADSPFKQVFNLLSSSGSKELLAFTAVGEQFYCIGATNYVWTKQVSGLVSATVTEGTNTGTGYITSASIDPGATPTDVYVITLSSATAFNVTKNGVATTAGTVGVKYTSADGKLTFTITAGSTAFVSGDKFTITFYAVLASGSEITKAQVGGETYFAIAGSGIFQYDFTLHNLVWRLAVGVDPSAILGITSSNGYLLIYSTDSILWSSVVDILDFVPSLSTGAGGGSVEDAKGPIRRCVGLTSGFLVFTASNCVAGVYAANTRYPFTFREVPNAGGISDLSLVTDEADSTAVYAFTSYGLQQISTQKATTIMPELSDFLTGKRFEDFNTVTLSFSLQNLTTPLKKRIEFISGRFLVISYGISSFTHAIVYDTALQRYGKLRTPHVSVFQYGFLDADDPDTPKKQIAFLEASGKVSTLEFAAGIPSTDSFVMLGKFQFIRARLLQLESAEFETIDPSSDCSVYDFYTLDGKTFQSPVEGYAAGVLTSTRKYNFRVTGVNHSLGLRGSFRLNSMLITFNVHGQR